MSDLDFDIDHYTDDELYQLVGLTPDSTKEVINYTTNELIQKYVGENKPLYYNFFMAVQNKLLGMLMFSAPGRKNINHPSDSFQSPHPNHPGFAFTWNP